jgi:hypothetical protein
MRPCGRFVTCRKKATRRGNGQFIALHGIAVDPRGDIYVAEVSNTYWPQLFNAIWGDGTTYQRQFDVATYMSVELNWLIARDCLRLYKRFGSVRFAPAGSSSPTGYWHLQQPRTSQ